MGLSNVWQLDAPSRRFAMLISSCLVLAHQETYVVCKQCESDVFVVCVFVVQHWSEDKDSVQGTDAAAPETSRWKQKVKRQLIDFIEFVFE